MFFTKFPSRPKYLGIKSEMSSNETLVRNKYPNLHFYIVPSVLITVYGTITNLLSLSYFITQRNFNNRQSSTEIINNHLFIALNVFDVLVCVTVSAFLLSVTIFFQKGNDFNLFFSIFIMVVQTTGFITCLLSVIRAISIIRPRHQLNVKAIIAAMIFYSIMIICLDIIELKNTQAKFIADFSNILALFVVVTLSNILCIIKLTHSKVASWKREATITMGILSTVYCVFNIGFLVNYGFRAIMCKSPRDSPQTKSCLSSIFEEISVFILLPMNSASNPVVYFLRNREMRRYLKNVWRKMTRRRSVQEVRPAQDMTISNIARDRTEVTEGRDDADL